MVVVCGCWGSVGRAATLWNLTNDYSTTSNPTNSWSFGYKLASATAPFTKFNTNGTLAQSVGSVNVWDYNGYRVPLVGKNILPTATVDGPSSVPSGEILLHPSPTIVAPTSPYEGLATVRWTAPAAGVYEVDFAIARWGGSTGQTGFNFVVDGVSNYSLLFGGSTYANQYGPTQTRTLSLVAGSTVDFCVSMGDGSDNFDSTGLRATIQAVPEPAATALLPVGAAVLRRRRRR
jgi:hypothetical protein